MLIVQQGITGPSVNVKQGIKETHMVQSVPKVRSNTCANEQLISLHIFFLFYTVPVKIAECTTDKDCPSRQSCLQEKCKDPCLAIAPCTSNAKCTVHNSLPLRTMSCTCLPGFTGKGDVRCDKIGKTFSILTKDRFINIQFS